MHVLFTREYSCRFIAVVRSVCISMVVLLSVCLALILEINDNSIDP